MVGKPKDQGYRLSWRRCGGRSFRSGLCCSVLALTTSEQSITQIPLEVRFGGARAAKLVRKFANGIANEPRSTAWHEPVRKGIAARKMPNQSARLATERHASARES